MGDGIKKIADQVRNHTRQVRVSKSNRMISASEPQYTRFQKYCQSKGLSTSEVVDRLISEFMAEVADDLPKEEAG